MRLGFFLKESIRSLRRNAAPSFAAMVTVVVTMLVLGVFVPIFQVTTNATNNVRSRLLVDVFLKTNAKPGDVARVERRLHGVAHVARVTFTSKAKAYAAQRKAHPDLYALLGRNPLPDTFHVYADKPENVIGIASAIAPSAAAGGTAPIDPAINNLGTGRSNAKRLLKATDVVRYALAILAVLLAGASVFLIANTIRLSLYARRREVEVMKLVGATDWFIRWPFVIEGVLVGALGSLLAIVVLGVVKVTLIDKVTSDFVLIALPKTIPFGMLIAILLGGGILISAIGSGLSLRRFLKV